MKWMDLPQSENVDVDCLGKRVNIKSPEASAALACQNEVSQLRDNFVKKADFNNAESIFDGELNMFGKSQEGKDQSKKEESSSFLSLFSPFKSEKPATDSFADRVNSFAKQLSIYSDITIPKTDQQKP